jgi:hypothetical protein
LVEATPDGICSVQNKFWQSGVSFGDACDAIGFEMGWCFASKRRRDGVFARSSG